MAVKCDMPMLGYKSHGDGALQKTLLYSFLFFFTALLPSPFLQVKSKPWPNTPVTLGELSARARACVWVRSKQQQQGPQEGGYFAVSLTIPK